MLSATAWHAGDIKGQRWDASRDKFKALCTAHPVDGLVVVLPRSSEDFLARTNQFFCGAGFYSRGLGDTTMVAVLHVVAHVAVVDCASAEPLASRLLTRFQRGNHYNIIRGMPMANVDAALARMKTSDWTDAVSARVRHELVALPAEAWKPTLSGLLRDD